jgi:phosphoglycolate phosphatase
LKFINKKVIIFDLDGTLIDSSPDLALAINYMLKSLERETFTTDTIHYWVGNGAEMLVKRALSGQREIDENLDSTLVTQALKIFLDFYGKNLSIKTVTYPNVLKTLQQLKEYGYRLAIVTNKPVDFVKPILKALSLEELFELYLGGNSLQERKPHPMPLLHVCETFNVTVEECVMVGDSKNDILSAHACNMQSIGVSYGYNYGESINIYNPNVVFDDFADILPTLIY